MTAPTPQAADIRFAADHPTAPGHFPGNPVIPGALLLDAALCAVAGAATSACTIRTAKFLRPVRPGDTLRIEWQWREGEAQFRGVLMETGDVAVTGLLRLGSADA